MPKPDKALRRDEKRRRARFAMRPSRKHVPRRDEPTRGDRVVLRETKPC